MPKTMTFHLGAAGVPISWHCYAVYSTSYGIACDAAAQQYEKTQASRVSAGDIELPPTPQYIVEIDRGVMKREQLWFPTEHYLAHQQHDEPSWLVQFHAFPLEIPEEIKSLVVSSLRAKLIEVGYLIPRAEWEAKYPDKVEALREFREMMAAPDA